MIKPRWWSGEGESAACGLCFRMCVIPRGGMGACRARGYDEDGFKSPHLGRFVSVAVDPIEKKPLRRWRPGTMILSLGGLHCNMMCPFCQNHAVAHPGMPLRERSVSFGGLIRKAHDAGLKSVAYTYNEPTLQAEYIFAASPVLRESGIATVMVTNGMFSEAVLDEATGLVDAMNVDVKTFDGAIYKKLGGSLETVRRNVERLISGGVHVEITNLIVPGVSDSESDFTAMTDWIAAISPEVPLHISRYFPAFRSSAPSTDVSLIRGFYDIARGRLKYVYMGNM